VDVLLILMNKHESLKDRPMKETVMGVFLPHYAL